MKLLEVQGTRFPVEATTNVRRHVFKSNSDHSWQSWRSQKFSTGGASICSILPIDPCSAAVPSRPYSQNVI